MSNVWDVQLQALLQSWKDAKCGPTFSSTSSLPVCTAQCLYFTFLSRRSNICMSEKLVEVFFFLPCGSRCLAKSIWSTQPTSVRSVVLNLTRWQEDEEKNNTAHLVVGHVRRLHMKTFFREWMSEVTFTKRFPVLIRYRWWCDDIFGAFRFSVLMAAYFSFTLGG